MKVSLAEGIFFIAIIAIFMFLYILSEINIFLSYILPSVMISILAIIIATLIYRYTCENVFLDLIMFITEILVVVFIYFAFLMQILIYILDSRQHVTRNFENPLNQGFEGRSDIFLPRYARNT